MENYPVAYFKCGGCGVKARSDIIEYDGLGYPVCPACGANRRPRADVDAGRWDADTDADAHLRYDYDYDYDWRSEA